MKSHSQRIGPEKVAYILPQGRRKPIVDGWGRPTSRKSNDSSGYMLVGMYESLSKTFVTAKAAGEWASKHGYSVASAR